MSMRNTNIMTITAIDRPAVNTSTMITIMTIKMAARADMTTIMTIKMAARADMTTIMAMKAAAHADTTTTTTRRRPNGYFRLPSRFLRSA